MTDQQRETAQDRHKKAYERTVAIGVIVSVGLHVALFQAFPQLTARDEIGPAEQMEAVELPPQVEIPPPPKQVARPARPKVAEAEVDEDITIAPTTLEDNPVEELPPPPKAGTPKNRPSFIPRDVEPRAVNDREIQRLLRQLYPSPLREAGVGGRVVLWLFVSKEGVVEKVQVQAGSDYESFNRAAMKVARNMEFKPAMNRDKPIGVWVQRAITFQVQQ